MTPDFPQFIKRLAPMGSRSTHQTVQKLRQYLEQGGTLISEGLPAALHVNARTEHDYARWGELIADRQEIEILAFEFATGCGRGERIDWHVA